MTAVIDRHACLACDADAPAGSVIDAVARDIGLRADERAALHRVVGSAIDAHPAAMAADPAALDAIWTPAVMVAEGGRILAVNRVGRLVLRGLGDGSAAGQSHPRWLFLDPVAPRVFADWDSAAREAVLALRRDVRRAPEDVALSRLVGRLLIASEPFARWWADADRAEADGSRAGGTPSLRRWVHLYGLRGRRSVGASTRWRPRSPALLGRRADGS
jgi:hypothetical protein